MIQFQNLRQGSQVFILHKGMTPFCELGTVEQMPNQLMSFYPNLPMMPIDLTIRVGEQLIPYQQIPPTAESAKVTSRNTGEEVCLACSKEAINAEIELLIRQSVDTINSVPMHEQRIEKLKQIHDQLNPEKVKEAQQVEEINSLKNQVTDLGKMVAELTAQLKDRNVSSFNKGGNKL